MQILRKYIIKNKYEKEINALHRPLTTKPISQFPSARTTKHHPVSANHANACSPIKSMPFFVYSICDVDYTMARNFRFPTVETQMLVSYLAQSKHLFEISRWGFSFQAAKRVFVLASLGDCEGPSVFIVSND